MADHVEDLQDIDVEEATVPMTLPMAMAVAPGTEGITEVQEGFAVVVHDDTSKRTRTHRRPSLGHGRAPRSSSSSSRATTTFPSTDQVSDGRRLATFDATHHPAASTICLYEIYKHWIESDKSIKINESHEIHTKPDVADAIGQIFATRLNQVVRPKWDLATNTRTQ